MLAVPEVLVPGGLAITSFFFAARRVSNISLEAQSRGGGNVFLASLVWDVEIGHAA